MKPAVTGARSCARHAVILMLVASASARAQQPSLTLAHALEAAQRSSPEVRAAREAVAAARARMEQSGAYANPTLSYGREQTSAAGITNAQNIAAIEQRLDPGGVRSARRRAAEYRHQAATARLAAVEAQLRLQVTRAYALAQAAEGRARLSLQAAEAFEQVRGISERRLAAGDVSGYAHRRIRLEAARYAALRAEAQLAQRSARVTLATLTGLGADSLDIPAPGSRRGAPNAISRDSLVRLALASRQDLRALGLEADAVGADAQLAVRERIPSPALSLGYKNERAGTGSETATGFIVGFSVPLPLWDRRGGAIEAAGADERQRRAEADVLRRRVQREVHEAYDAHFALMAQVDALAPQLGAETHQAMNAVHVAYAEGEVTLVEWLDAVRAFQEAESTLASLRAEALIRFAELEHAVGTTLPSLPNGEEGT